MVVLVAGGDGGDGDGVRDIENVFDRDCLARSTYSGVIFR